MEKNLCAVCGIEIEHSSISKYEITCRKKECKNKRRYQLARKRLIKRKIDASIPLNEREIREWDTLKHIIVLPNKKANIICTDLKKRKTLIELEKKDNVIEPVVSVQSLSELEKKDNIEPAISVQSLPKKLKSTKKPIPIKPEPIVKFVSNTVIANDPPKKRKCLRCDKEFMSTWSGNRLCTKCASGRPSDTVVFSIIVS